MIPSEINNEECKAALIEIGKAKSMSLERVKYPLETAALLWHGLLEASGDKVYLSAKGITVFRNLR